MRCGAQAPISVFVPTAASDNVIWEGWGTSLAWFAHALGYDPVKRDVICRLLFHKEQGLGLNIVRYNVGGANQAQEHEYRPGAAVPCSAQPDGTYDWEADANQVSMLLAAADLGADTFEAFVNSPPWFWTVSGSSRGHQYPLKNNLAKEHIQDFAEFCADVVAHFESVHGIKMRSLSPFNEPASPAWCLAVNCKQEACYFSKRRAHKVLRALLQQPALQNTQLVAFEQFCVRDTLSDLKHLPKDLRPAVARVNTHTYDSSTFFAKAAKPLVMLQDNRLVRWKLRRLLHRWGGTALWVSEFGTGRGALKLAQHIVKDLASLLPSAWVYWQAVEGVGSGWGLLETDMQHPPQRQGQAAFLQGSSNGATAAASTSAAAAGKARAEEAAAASAAAETGRAGPSAQAAARPEPQAAGAGAGRGDAVSVACEEVLLHPNFFVLQFLVQAVPVGSRLCRVKGFGMSGFGVLRPPGDIHGQRSLLYINSSKHVPQQLHVDATALLQQQVGLTTGAAQASDAGASTPAAAATAHISTCVWLLNIDGLQPVVVNFGAGVLELPRLTPTAVTVQSGGKVSGTGRSDDTSMCVIEVPPAHLCRIDVMLQ